MNQIDREVNKMVQKRAIKIDEAMIAIFNPPKWISNRLWLFRIYSRINRLEIVEYLDSGKIKFRKRGKVVGEAIFDSYRKHTNNNNKKDEI